jgi:1-hydroxycarotenoid 3,4-desaturase
MAARAKRVIVVGAGVGGLVAALKLALCGIDVSVFERADGPGGKMRQTRLGDALVDAGPTVLTMRWVFDEIFESAGTSLDSRLGLTRLSILARHAWQGGERLDLHADAERSALAIADFAGVREAEGFRRFCARARKIYRTLEHPFIEQPCAGPSALVCALGLRGLVGLSSIAPFTTMHRALQEYFRDPRLVQLFGRYATYCGSSPYLAPATLMLVAHVEQRGVWTVDGGMHRLATAMADLAQEHGVSFHYRTGVKQIDVRGGEVQGVTTDTDEYVAADAVVVNADAQAIAHGFFGEEVAAAVARITTAKRSLSAVTWAMVATCSGFPLVRHNVFFSNDYQLEFEQLFASRSSLPTSPTVYVCAQQRLDTSASPGDNTPERLLCLVNAPARGDTCPLALKEIQLCEQHSQNLLEQCGLTLRCAPHNFERTDPTAFNHLFPATGGALYGPVSHGWTASFQRPSARTRIEGLYLAGGSIHPGPGIPMAALSGRIAADTLLADQYLMQRSSQMAMRGGISMR